MYARALPVAPQSRQKEGSREREKKLTLRAPVDELTTVLDELLGNVEDLVRHGCWCWWVMLSTWVVMLCYCGMVVGERNRMSRVERNEVENRVAANMVSVMQCSVVSCRGKKRVHAT